MCSIYLKLLTIFFTIVSGIHCFPLLAYEAKDAINNFAHELTNCAAYYYITSDAIKHYEKSKNTSSDLSEKYISHSLSMLDFSIRLTNHKLTSARYEIALNNMLEDINSDYSNMSIIMNKYGRECQYISENPDSRLYYWLEKK